MHFHVNSLADSFKLGSFNCFVIFILLVNPRNVKKIIRQVMLTLSLPPATVKTWYFLQLVHMHKPVSSPNLLYTPEQKRRRDESIWTLVQGILAPVQFLIFLVSLAMVVHCLVTGRGESAALTSVVVKTLTLYTIMLTGCVWEKVVFGQYLFAPAFFWEDVFSMLVLALHTTYLYVWWTGVLTPTQQLWLAIAAYLTYCINAGQFLLKLRAARLQAEGLLTQAPDESQNCMQAEGAV